MNARLAIGIGCRKGCGADAIVALVREATAGIPSVQREKVAAAKQEPDEGDETEMSSPASTSSRHPLPLAGEGRAALFTAESKCEESGIAEAAAALGLPLVFLPHAALVAAAPRCATRSARVEAVLGLPSLAEAAALAGAGPDARLVVTRIAGGGATCAIAALPEITP